MNWIFCYLIRQDLAFVSFRQLSSSVNGLLRIDSYISIVFIQIKTNSMVLIYWQKFYLKKLFTAFSIKDSFPIRLRQLWYDPIPVYRVYRSINRKYYRHCRTSHKVKPLIVIVFPSVGSVRRFSAIFLPDVISFVS